MASMFRPPESNRSHQKTPKLTLPVNLVQNAKSTNDGQHLNRSPYSSVNESPYSNNSTSATSTTSSMASNSTLLYNRSSTTTIKNRPVPPPLPPLVLTQKKDGIEYRVAGDSQLSERFSNLHVDITYKELLSSAPISTKLSNIDTTFIKKDLDTPEGEDSYPSTLLSAYDFSSSGSNSAPLSANNIISCSNLIQGTDVDQLEEEAWRFGYLKDEITTLGILGEGAGGSVAKCRLKNGKKVFALKTINTMNTDPEYQKQIFRELQFNKSFKSDYIVQYYGMFTDEQSSSIYIAMEYMGGKSLEATYKNLLKRGGRISERVIGKIAESVLRGLSYLHERKVIHRDIKPQNILLNEKGEIKLCDFGVSGEAVNSLAMTFTGTSFYMAPERIQGQPYSVTCDVWSLGLTLLEVAGGRFPFESDKITQNVAPIELLTMILTFSPQLKDEPELDISWSKTFRSFIDYCLKKDARERPSPRQMLKHPWIVGQMKKKVNMERFVKKCWEKEKDGI
ncbi:AAC_HP2_G0053000.mRNA.1.CDS.1 [Saccharomyces cerevisiae]|nr:ATV_HP_G0058260.mRNA.1.CDS.1 [Saccharomyces cerevisiae]CAI5337783.1 AAC_HP2_G0053000.mRNA.1.CDS.1 [Saccharomyces cerevisiae]CAI6807922.1 AAC_HP2_G0053000.mRNA.1.CDS.1 [Saccharomyces cerevisiae]CAI6817323.1 AAC_HP1_G0054540.mRNA.1.CDS.1 [Saccharomyces cerevisiae]CAI6907143.1 AAC_collapsed_G0054590.mRNA.1.CDS.1 [Saccharomyces cerevisiae]